MERRHSRVVRRTAAPAPRVRPRMRVFVALGALGAVVAAVGVAVLLRASPRAQNVAPNRAAERVPAVAVPSPGARAMAEILTRFERGDVGAAARPVERRGEADTPEKQGQTFAGAAAPPGFEGPVSVELKPSRVRRSKGEPVWVRVRAAKLGRLLVRVENAAGGTVRKLYEGEAAYLELYWDLTDDGKRLLPAGTFQVAVETAGRVERFGIVLE